MITINSIAGSAFQSYGASQQVTANNIANVSTENFNASRVSFQDNGNGGVTASVSATQDSVDISREATTLLSTTQNFKASFTVLKVADDMTRQLLSIKV
jgi:flagellar basal body rod protein FlgB